MTIKPFLDIANQLKPFFKIGQKYCLAILIEVDVACAIYKLVQGINLLVYRELFVASKFIISFIV
jgi:hypothetical protein